MVASTSFTQVDGHRRTLQRLRIERAHLRKASTSISAESPMRSMACISLPSGVGRRALRRRRRRPTAVRSRRRRRRTRDAASANACPSGMGARLGASCRIDDVRIGAVRLLINPALLQERADAGRHAGAGRSQPQAIADVLHGRDDRLVVDGRPVFDPRPRPGAWNTPPAQGRRPMNCAAPAAHRDARVLREAAHHGGLEGLHQRPAPGRQLRHQRGVEMARACCSMLALGRRSAPSSSTC